MKARVATRYQIKFNEGYDCDDFAAKLDAMTSHYPDLVSFHLEDDGSPEGYVYEINKAELKKIVADKDFSKELRQFATELLNTGDPEREYIHVEWF